MELLLDTCDFLWFTLDDPRLPASKRNVLESAEHAISVSVVTFWEITIKHGIGRLPLPQPAKDFAPDRCRHYGFGLLNLEPPAVAQLAGLPTLHRDPFDRMLVAVALEYGLTLSSCDPEVRKYPVPLL